MYEIKSLLKILKEGYEGVDHNVKEVVKKKEKGNYKSAKISTNNAERGYLK